LIVTALPITLPLQEFETHLLAILNARSEPITEYELIQQLRDKNLFRIDAGDLISDDLLVMFRIHFVLFHALYRIRDGLRQQGVSDLELSPVAINLKGYSRAASALAETDPLYSYYIDLQNIAQTDADDVEEMLGRFWSRLGNTDRRAEALAELDLQDPVSEQDIRKRYRVLVMRHHPDRGGSKEKIQSINAAMSILLNSFNTLG
jgi:hypothetical protein